MKDRDVLLFENLRINEGEKNPPAGGDDGFAKKLSQMADIYVNDAFSVSHRAHASIVGVPKFLPSYGGPLLRKEIENLSKAFNPERPFVFILGGAKFDTKLPIIKKYIQKADNIFVGGALANNFFRAMGVQTGTSLVAEGDFGEKEMLESKSLKNPVDVTVKGSGNDLHFKNLEEISKDDYIGDVGPKTIELLKEITKDAKTIVWNGPLGNFEAGFNDKTEQLAEIIAELSHSNGCTTIIGGGDTISSIQKLGILDKFSFVSTGGGAMLDFLVEETLVGIEALK
jgi:phosphoglycerate kinase